MEKKRGKKKRKRKERKKEKRIAAAPRNNFAQLRAASHPAAGPPRRAAPAPGSPRRPTPLPAVPPPPRPPPVRAARGYRRNGEGGAERAPRGRGGQRAARGRDTGRRAAGRGRDRDARGCRDARVSAAGRRGELRAAESLRAAGPARSALPAATVAIVATTLPASPLPFPLLLPTLTSAGAQRRAGHPRPPAMSRPQLPPRPRPMERRCGAGRRGRGSNPRRGGPGAAAAARLRVGAAARALAMGLRGLICIAPPLPPAGPRVRAPPRSPPLLPFVEPRREGTTRGGGGGGGRSAGPEGAARPWGYGAERAVGRLCVAVSGCPGAAGEAPGRRRRRRRAGAAPERGETARHKEPPRLRSRSPAPRRSPHALPSCACGAACPRASHRQCK